MARQQADTGVAAVVAKGSEAAGWNASDLLAAVKGSPTAVAAHDRGAWVALFSGGAQVNDPVGSRPHVGKRAIERFYDTFIAPNSITFDVDRDVVCGMSVFRDLTVNTVMSTGVTLRVPMHLRYDLIEEGGVLFIDRLYAHWELPSMIAQLVRAGVSGILASARLGPQLLANQGIGGALGFMRGFVRVGRRGKVAATGLLVAARKGDAEELRRRLQPGAVLELPVGTVVSAEQFVDYVRDLHWTKMIASGRTVTVSVESDTLRGVALVEFAARRRGVAAVRMFV